MNIQIVPLEANHIPECAKILGTTPLWVESYGATIEWGLRTLEDGLADPTQTLRTAVDGEKVLGFAYYGMRGAFYYGSYLRLLAVRADYRGQGVGAKLLRDVEERVAAKTPNLFLISTRENTAAHRFYERHGYAHIGTLPGFVVPHITEYIFWKQLRPTAEAPNTLGRNS